MTSRTMVARYVATSLIDGGDRKKVTLEAAAWLKKTNKTRQARYLAQDVAVALSESGYIFVKFVTARPITKSTEKSLESFVLESTDAKTVECEFITDEKLIGGVVIQTPYGTLDASVRARLSKIVEGVSR